ncbi:MAG: phage tail sheath C-terminal domain-containing protein, partial [Bacteroidia bacterium]
QQFFGGPFNEQFKAVLRGVSPSPTSISVSPVTSLSQFILFYQVQMFYANGGGTCYIVSVGSYTGPSKTALDFSNAIDTFEQIDEITILSAPESVFFNAGGRQTINVEMAKQCAKLQDRFALVDVIHKTGNTIFQDASDFRNGDINADNLKYVGAYYPALQTPIVSFYRDAEVLIDDNRTGAPLYTGTNNKSLFTVFNGIASYNEFTVATPGTNLVAGDTFTLNVGTSVTLTPGTSFAIGTTTADSINNLVDAINGHPVLSKFVTATVTSTPTPLKFLVMANLQGAAGNYAFTGGTTKYGADTSLAGGVDNSADKNLYNLITAELAKYTLSLYPCASMAGTYARVDSDRGVWKAPANVGLSLVNAPSINITDDDQQDLNVDSVSGKSINAIRTFTGRGVLVWGARTLAGNDNEWRYINVRRLFTYVEDSTKKATEFVVFEPNNANTWQRVKGMIESFLTDLWREGALAGATPKDAFFVQVGLGTTMTADDILNGKMIVTIGMAAVRPAEFIILQFEHKLQVS